MDTFRPVIKRPSLAQSDLLIRRQRWNSDTLTQIALPFPTFHLEFLASETCKQLSPWCKQIRQRLWGPGKYLWLKSCLCTFNYFWLLENLTLVGRSEDLSACIRGRVVQCVFGSSLLDIKSKITFTDALVIRVCVQSFH